VAKIFLIHVIVVINVGFRPRWHRSQHADVVDSSRISGRVELPLESQREIGIVAGLGQR